MARTNRGLQLIIGRVINHEIQHYAQNNEDSFVKGTNREAQAKLYAEKLRNQNKDESEIAQFLSDSKIKGTEAYNIADKLYWTSKGEIEARANEFVFDTTLPPNQRVEFLSKPNGEVLGFVSDGKIYLNPEALSANTAFHELTHIQQAVIKIAAKNGDSKAKSILRRFNVLFADAISQIKKGNRVVLLDGVKVDLSSEVYKKGANESEEAYTERLKDELWAYIQAPVNLAKWDKATTGIVSRFIERVKEWFKDKLGIKDAENIQSMTLAEIINASSNSLMKGEYFDLLDENKKENPTRFDVSNYKVYLQKIKDYAADIKANREKISRYDEQVERGRIEGGSRNVEATLLLTGSGSGSGQIKGRDGQEQAIEKYAKYFDVCSTYVTILLSTTCFNFCNLCR